MSSPYLLAMHGNLVIVGYQPDGDSIRFIAETPDLFDDLYRGYKIRRSTRDDSVQLRLEAIDAPELHYGGSLQPSGDTARDWLLGQVGFTDVTYETGSTTVLSATPDTIPAVIYTKASDPNDWGVTGTNAVAAGDTAFDIHGTLNFVTANSIPSFSTNAIAQVESGASLITAGNLTIDGYYTSEIGIQQVAELMPVAGIELLGPLPAELQTTIVYSAAVPSKAKEAEAAKAFVSFLSSEAAVSVIKQKGMQPAGG